MESAKNIGMIGGLSSFSIIIVFVSDKIYSNYFIYILLLSICIRLNIFHEKY